MAPVMHPVMEFFDDPARGFLKHAGDKGVQQRRASRSEQKPGKPQGKPHMSKKTLIYAGRVGQKNSGDHRALLIRIDQTLGNMVRAYIPKIRIFSLLAG